MILVNNTNLLSKMKKFGFIIFTFAGLLFGCQKAEIVDLGNENNQAMKTVTLSAGVDEVDTKASLDSKEGFFKWQAGDVISVLATDGKFYDFTIVEGAGNWKAEFEGNIPTTAEVTSVATYPAFMENGAENTVFAENTLNFNLPTEYTYAHESSNVPMVATFAEGAEDIRFVHVGGVMRFPVHNLPANATITLTMHDKTVTGAFPIDLTNLGEAAMVAGTQPSTVTVRYMESQKLETAYINVPVPTGVYDNFNLTITDGSGQVVITKDYVSKSNVVKRSTLLMMRELGFLDNGIGTEPDDTDYDAFGMGEMPISFWWTVPEYAHGYDDAKTRELYADMAASGINVVLYNGEVNTSVAENKRIMDIAGELGMKFIGNVWGATIDEKFALIKEHLSSSPTYR